MAQAFKTNQFGEEGFVLNTMQMSKQLNEAGDICKQLVLNMQQEIFAAIMVIDGRMPLQQELLDFGRIKLVMGGIKIFSWRGQDILRFDEPEFIDRTEKIKGKEIIVTDVRQPVHWLFKIEDNMEGRA